MNETIKQQLYSLQDLTYQAFQQKLIPNTPGIIGVRIPQLRKLAKQIMKQDYVAYLNESCDNFEEVMLQGMIIGYAKDDVITLLPYIEKHIMNIHNWATCDIFVGNLKFTKQHQQMMYEFILPYLQSDQEFDIRFGVVMLLNYYLDEFYIKKAFAHFNRIKHAGYYVKMAVAWAISMYFVAYPIETLAYLKDNELDDFTYHKTLAKICESLQVNKETKQMIKQLKRKTN